MTDSIPTEIVDRQTNLAGGEFWTERRESIPGIIEERFVLARPWQFAIRQPADNNDTNKEVCHE